MSPLSVCVIGAGAAGLCAARHLAARPDKFSFQVFELTAKVGGTWVYTERIGMDENGQAVHSSMYKNLRTNIPKEIMAYLDYPFPESNESYIHHSEVLKYLENYAKDFDLYQYIKFQTVVKLVTPKITEGGRTGWSVTVQNLNTLEETTSIFDSVMVCNGHYAVPNIPDILDIEAFQGRVLHSHDYRQPDGFEGTKIAVFGAASSGLDITLELADVADEIYLCHSLAEPVVSKLPQNVKQRKSIKSALSDGFVLQDGTSIQAEVLMYCTGYKFNFPFLTPECGITVQGRRVQPVYKHLIHIEHPSMCFVGIPFIVLPFPVFDHQVQFFLSTLDGSLELPSKNDMYQDAANDFQRRLEMQMPPRYAHKLGALQWEYMRDLGGQIGISPLPAFIKEYYDMNSYRRKHHIVEYKDDVYRSPK
ncbi:uncharacterized protein [Anabrus simplex]|uniref:uncharacterized protein n=1 Tax=Anabrus simplex TaxID=316456 RepID=UPI0035A2CBBB